MDKPDPSTSPDSSPSGLASFWAELKRRKVMRVAITYAVVAWLLIQVSATVFPQFDIPDWGARFVTLLLLIGFPVAIILAWAFELTPDGIKTTKKADVERGEAPVSEKQQRRRNWFTFMFGAAVPTVIFGALAIYFYATRSGSDPSPLDSSPTSHPVEGLDKSIAVLPLGNLSPDPNNAFFADGVHEDILTNLSKIKDLLVIGRTSTLQYRGSVKTLQQIGEELGVRYLVEGSVRRASGQVLITVKLIDSQTGGNLWSENYNRSLDDIFAIQAEVTKKIAKELEAVISPAEIAQIDRRPTENQEAYDFYLKYRQQVGMGEKIALLEKAVAIDPEYAEAWSFLAHEVIYVWDDVRNRSDPELRERAHYALKEAERTGPDLPHLRVAKHTMALRDDRDLEKAVEYLLEALAIDPTFYLAHSRLSQRYFQLGRLAEALHHSKTALKIDPMYLQANTGLRAVYRSSKMFDEFREQIGKIIEILGNNTYWTWELKTIDYLQNGRKEEFLESIETDPIYKDDLQAKMVGALLSEDYKEALRLVIDQDFGRQFSFTGYGWRQYYFSIEPPELLAALIHFHREDQESWLEEAGKAEAYIEEILDANPIANPRYWAYLSICQALAGDSDSIPETIENVREMTRSKFWQFEYHVLCEIHIAIAYLVMGDHEQALSTLEAASKMDSRTFLNRELDLWFIFDRLRGNPRFDALLED